MSFKIGDLVLLSDEGIAYASCSSHRTWSRERCKCVGMIIEEDVMPDYFREKRPQYSVLLISGLQTRTVIVPKRDLILLADA